jgi:hypothetical protein
MFAKLGAQCAYGILCATLFVGATVAAYAQGIRVEPQPTQTILMAPYAPTTINTPRPYKTVHILNPNVADAIAVTDRRITFVPKAVGITSVNILDENNDEIASLNLEVDDVGPARVHIHNKRLLTSYTTYRCTFRGCQYVDELTAKEPAPAPPTVTETRERRDIYYHQRN